MKSSGNSSSSPSRLYHGIPVSDDIHDYEVNNNTTNNNENQRTVHTSSIVTHAADDDDDNDNDPSSESRIVPDSISPSLSLKMGRTNRQYSRIISTDDTHEDINGSTNSAPNKATTTTSLQHNEFTRNNDETNSLVTGAADTTTTTSPPSSIRKNRKGIFRQLSPASMDSNNNNNNNNNNNGIARTQSGGANSTITVGSSSHKTRTTTSNSMIVPYTDEIIPTTNNITPTGLLSRQSSRCASSSHASSVDWDDDDDFDNDDDIANIRRYHLDFSNNHGLSSQSNNHTMTNQHWMSSSRGANYSIDDPSNVSWSNILNDCCRCRIRKSMTTISYLWQSLRQGARQRRAARLLTMPSENVRYKLQSCIISWFCDATDVGIAFTAICLVLWILIGCIRQNATIQYWLMGVSLFIVRISARRSYEICRSFVLSNISHRRQQQQYQQQQQQYAPRERLGSRQHLTIMDDTDHQLHDSDTNIETTTIIVDRRIPNSV